VFGIGGAARKRHEAELIGASHAVGVEHRHSRAGVHVHNLDAAVTGADPRDGYERGIGSPDHVDRLPGVVIGAAGDYAVGGSWQEDPTNEDHAIRTGGIARASHRTGEVGRRLKKLYERVRQRVENVDRRVRPIGQQVSMGCFVHIADIERLQRLARRRAENRKIAACIPCRIGHGRRRREYLVGL
jgi:hypothetical protein